MFKKQINIIVILFLIIFQNLTFAQPSINQIDSINSIGYEKIIINLKQSLNLFTENLENARKLNYKKGEGIALSNLALTSYLLGKYDKSIEYHIQSFDIFSKNNMLRELAEAYGEFGYQLKRRDTLRANEYMRRAIIISEALENNEGLLSKLYDNYAVIKEMETKYDSALFYTKKALEIKFKLNDSIGIPFTFNKIASIYANKKNFKEAFKFLNISDYYRKRQNNVFTVAENKVLRADFHYLQKNLDSALIYYFESFQLADSLNYNYLISYSLEKISDIYLLKEDHKQAFEYFQKFTSYKDSLTNFETNSRIAQLEIEYETEQKDKLIALNELKIQQRNTWLIISFISIALISIFTFFLFKYQKQKREREIKELEYQNEIKRTSLEKKLLNEKLRISRELHDNIGSQLTFIFGSIDNIIYSNQSNPAIDSLSSLKEFSLSALLDLRNTIWAMKEEKGDFEKLFLKVNDFIQRLDGSLLSFNFSIQNLLSTNYPLSSVQMLNLFRIIQEAIQNSVKHSSAKNIQIIFTQIEENPSVIIKDDGKGFDISKESNGSGLENMKRRSEDSNANFNIESDMNGTSIIVSVLSN